MSARRTVVRTLLGGELRGLLRDRRALFVAVVLPALLYPLLFLGMEKLEDVSRESMASREVGLALDVSRVPAELAREARERLERGAAVRVVAVDAGTVLEEQARADEPDGPDEARRAALRSRVDGLLGGWGHVLLAGEPHPERERGTLWHLWYDVKDELSREGRERVQRTLEELGEQLADERRVALLGADPARGLELETVDVASEQATRGAALGRLLPILAVLVLVSGGSYAALSVFAGEREAGTLETLLVQPVPARAIALSKFLAVLLAGVATLVVNVSSLVLCVSMGWGRLPADPGAAGGALEIARLAGTLAYLPACLLIAAVLCRALVGARTFREGQLTVLPVTLAALVPSAVVLAPDLETDWWLAVLPLAGPSLLMRDALRGSLAAGLLAPMTLSHLLYSAALLASLARALDGERLLSSAFVKEEARQRRELGRHALRWSFISVLTLYVVGGSLQDWRLDFGLLATFWVLCPLLALAALRHPRRRTGQSFAALLGLRAPAPLRILGSLLCVPALIRLAHLYADWQSGVLPLPGGADGGTGLERLQAFLEDLGTPQLLFLLAVSPGFGEELLFRGALLAGMRRDFSARAAILWQAFFFAAAHASLWRLVPTAFLGAFLTAITLRARSLWPAILVHVAYDALLVAEATGRLDGAFGTRAAWLPWMALPGLLMVFAPVSGPRHALSSAR